MRSKIDPSRNVWGATTNRATPGIARNAKRCTIGDNALGAPRSGARRRQNAVRQRHGRELIGAGRAMARQLRSWEDDPNPAGEEGSRDGCIATCRRGTA